MCRPVRAEDGGKKICLAIGQALVEVGGRWLFMSRLVGDRETYVMSLMSTFDVKRMMHSADRSSTSAFRSKTVAHGAESDESCRWTVGPGAYEISSFFSAEKLPTNGHRSAFRSGRRSPINGPPSTPGPGAYTDKSFSGGWGSRSPGGKAPAPRSRAPLPSPSSTSDSNTPVWARRATAPSIPSLDTAMGYEEDADGKLVRQDAPRPPEGGVAPNHYTPLSTLTKPRSINGVWDLAGRGHGATFAVATAASALAPGHSTGVTANPRPRRFPPSSSFAPKAAPTKDLDSSPWAGGPGAPALLEHAMPPAPKVPPKQFGSPPTPPRATPTGLSCPCPHRAGPGQYETGLAADCIGSSRPI